MNPKDGKAREILLDLIGLLRALRYPKFWGVFILLMLTILSASLVSGAPIIITLVFGFPFVVSIGFVHFHNWLIRVTESVTSGPEAVSDEEAAEEFEYKKALGEAHMNENHRYFEDASECYERALCLRPGDICTRMHLAGIYRDRLMRPDAALRHFKTLAHDAPMDSMIREDALLAVKVLVRDLGEKTGPAS